MRFLPVLLGALLSGDAIGAQVFDNGLVNDYSGTDLVGPHTVRDSVGGNPTTLNMRPGAQLGGGSTFVLDDSVLELFAGSTISIIRAEDSGTVRATGGDTTGRIDLLFTSTGLITAGTLDAGTGTPLRLFDDATALVTGGVFLGGTIVIQTVESGSLRIDGGDFGSGALRAEDFSAIDIYGGSMTNVVAAESSTVTLFGKDFVASQGGSTVLAGFGELTNFNGTITGTLADGTGFSMVGFAGFPAGRIVLAPGSLTNPSSVPAIPPVGLGVLACALLAAGVSRSVSLDLWRSLRRRPQASSRSRRRGTSRGGVRRAGP